ncbi:hypothetical protein C7S13_7186 [Burkholderia cepacia]|nr:hypothetical protein [Burkholderia cepacia]
MSNVAPQRARHAPSGVDVDTIGELHATRVHTDRQTATGPDRSVRCIMW